MTTARVTQDNGQEAWLASCDKPTAEGKSCDYVARSNESEVAAEAMLLTHQNLRPNDGETGLRPAREIAQHYPHFISYDRPNAGQLDAAPIDDEDPDPAEEAAVTVPKGEDDGQSQP